jgi:hypothetical protein
LEGKRWEKKECGWKKSVIASPNFAVEPSWGGRICDFNLKLNLYI